MKKRSPLLGLFLMTFFSFLVVLKSFDKNIWNLGLAIAVFIGFLLIFVFAASRAGKKPPENSTN